MANPAPFVLSGVIPPMITPLTPRGDVDGDAIARLATHLIDGGVAGIFVLGTSGEGPWLTSKQSEQVIASTVSAVAGRVPVLAGVLEPSTGRTLEAVAVAEAAGADALVVTSPYYFEVDAATQRRHVEAIAAATSLPLILYNIPQMTHNPFVLETVRNLLEIETVAGIKESGDDWSLFEQLLDLRSTSPGFRVYQGAERSSARAALAGADGVVSGLANLAPRLLTRLFIAAGAGRDEAAIAIQARVDALWRLHTHGFWLACLKYAASVMGFGGGAVCGNAVILSPEAQTAIRRLIEQETLTTSNEDPATWEEARALTEQDRQHQDLIGRR